MLLDYTITNEILANIATIERAKTIVENTTILPSWKKKIEIETKAKIITYSLQRENINANLKKVTQFLNQIKRTIDQNVTTYIKALEKVEELAINKEFDEPEIKEIYRVVTNKTTYRSKPMQEGASPEVILAQMTEILDWVNTLEAKQTHPLIAASLFKAKIQQIKPFETHNDQMADLLFLLCLKSRNYISDYYFCVEEYLYNTVAESQKIIRQNLQNEDYTAWLAYITDGFSRETSNVAENIRILAKDTKIAKAAGTTNLSERQEKIITYLQDFGRLTNKDFDKLFPKISEDTVLRELKGLIEEGIIVKKGKTKSSRYELV